MTQGTPEQDHKALQDRIDRLDEASRQAPEHAKLPKVLVPILGHRNRAFRRAWIKANPKVWKLALKHNDEVREVEKP